MKQHPLRKWREARKLTLQAAAKQVGIADITWARWERGVCLPQMRLLPKVIKLTGLKAEQFMGVG